MSTDLKTRFRDLGLDYEAAAHAMQTGVKYELGLHGTGDTSAMGPKHLRVGVNSAMVDSSALACLLMDKGLISETEYHEYLRIVMNNEVAMYEARHPKIKFR